MNQKKTNGLGIAALIFGIISLVSSCFVIGIFPAIVGLILGIIGLAQKNLDKGCAIAGTVCSFIAIIISVAMIYVVAKTPTETSTQTQNETRVESSDTETTQKSDVFNQETQVEMEDTTDTEEPIETEEEYKASCQEYNYKDVLRNPDDYIGKRVKVTVKISTVHSAKLLTDKYYFAWSQDEYGMWYGYEYGIFEKRDSEDPKLLEDDVITVYGEISEPRETQSFIVNSEELFCIDMKYVDLISE